MSVRIDKTRCIGCGKCADICPGNLIRLDADGKAALPRPEECWGCASCLKECRREAIFYYLGADIGGAGAWMQVAYEGALRRWTIQRPGQPPVVVTVDSRNANQY